MRLRAAATERARRLLLKVARTIHEIPEGCSLSSWVFLTVHEELHRDVACHEPWRALAAAEREQLPDYPALSPADQASNERHLEAHPECRKLLERYRRFLLLPQDAELVSRAGWDQAEDDLGLFLEAQFGEEDPAALRGKTALRDLLPSVPWIRSKTVAFAVFVAVVILGVLLWRSWHVRSGAQADAGIEQQSAEQATSQETIARLSAPTPTPIPNARLAVEGQSLLVRWERVAGPSEYTVEVLTPKLDPIYKSSRVEQPLLRIQLSDVADLHRPGSYLFRIEGLVEGRVTASSGYLPFEYR